MVSVLSNAEMRRQLIKEAYEEMEFFQKKFKDLEELKTIFLEMDRVKVKLSKKQDLIAA